jgi:hypothetical protein
VRSHGERRESRIKIRLCRPSGALAAIPAAKSGELKVRQSVAKTHLRVNDLITGPSLNYLPPLQLQSDEVFCDSMKRHVRGSHQSRRLSRHGRPRALRVMTDHGVS